MTSVVEIVVHLEIRSSFFWRSDTSERMRARYARTSTLRRAQSMRRRAIIRLCAFFEGYGALSAFVLAVFASCALLPVVSRGFVVELRCTNGDRTRFSLGCWQNILKPNVAI